jgi:lysophospholipase L1-like esterase
MRGLGKRVMTGAVLAGLAVTPTVAQQQPAAAAAAQQRGRLATQKDLPRHVDFMDRKERLIRTGGTELAFVGDSITDGWRRDPQREMFEDYFGRYRPYNIGIGGDETQHVLWRIEHGELDGIAPRLVVLMIGTNNLANANKMTPAETADGVAAVVEAIRRKQPAAKVLLLGIFPRANRSDDPMRLAVSETNRAIARLGDGRTVIYRDIGAKFLAADGTLSGEIMPDYLHPNAKGYQIWADAIKAEIDRLLGAR